MIRSPLTPVDVASSTPPIVQIATARSDIRRANRQKGSRVVVLDDDPTGSQAVHDIPVVTSWNRSDLVWAFTASADGFFILTNTRSMDPASARRVVLDAAKAVQEVASELAIPVVLISRGDSTLRGHFPLELDAIDEAMSPDAVGHDVRLFLPAYPEAGRVTKHAVHYVQVDGVFIPAADTSYAADASFGYKSSDLREHIAARSSGRTPAASVLTITLEDIRIGKVERISDVVRSVADGGYIAVDALEPADLDIVALGVLRAEASGIRVLTQCGPSYVAARLGVPSRPPLGRHELGRRTGHGLIVVGSHVALTTRQVQHLQADGTVAVVELQVPALLDADRARAEVQRCGEELSRCVGVSDVMLVTSRTEVTGRSAQANLEIAQLVSRAVVEIVRTITTTVDLGWVIAKGGITSHDIARHALHVDRAMILGQLFPGIVSVWRVHTGSGHSSGDLPYVVFPGNVGDQTTLLDAVRILRGGG